MWLILSLGLSVAIVSLVHAVDLSRPLILYNYVACSFFKIKTYLRVEIIKTHLCIAL